MLLTKEEARAYRARTLRNLRINARRRGMEVAVKVKHITKFPLKCKYLDVELSYETVTQGQERPFNHATIDRIDSRLPN